MTKQERDDARTRCEAATEAPWIHDAPGCVAKHWTKTLGKQTISMSPGHHADKLDEANADFIAHARTDLPAALDALDSADKRIEELELEVTHLKGYIMQRTYFHSRGMPLNYH